MPRKKRQDNQFRRQLAEAELEMQATRVADSRDATGVPVIYHYTDPKGLIGILSTGQLWATDIRYLNDSSELRHAEEIQRQVLEEIAGENPAGSIQKQLAAAALAADHGFSAKGMRKTYVVCFCAEDDILTQWKAYGSWGSGFSIGFDRKQLELALPALGPPPPSPVALFGWSDTRTELARVRYSEEDQRQQLRSTFDRYAALISAPSMFQVGMCATTMVENAAISASRFKHPAFESEQEWRIIISSSAPIPDLNLSFRSSRRTVIPYMTTRKPPDRKLPVVSITVGPTLDQELSRRSVFALLMAKGYFDDEIDVEIKTSGIPLTRTD